MIYKERTLKKRLLYRGKAVNFYADTVQMPDGKKAIREYTGHPGAAACLPILPGGRIILVRQYRYPVKKIMLEAPAGKISENETPLKCIRRELEEETGMSAGKFIRLGKFHPTCAFSTETIHLFAALNLKKSRLNPDDDEFIEKVVINFDAAMELVKKGQISDSKTIILLLLWKNFQSER